MKKYWICFSCVCFLCASFPVYVCAGEEVCAEEQAHEIIMDVLSWKLQQTDSDQLQTWIDGAMTEGAGSTAEWYVLALSQYDSFCYTAYEAALLSYLETNQVRSASTRLKCALVLHAIGSDDAYITETLRNSVGEQGIMSWIFGLHLLNQGYQSEMWTTESVAQTIVSMQNQDGGWAIQGTTGDVDVTAMALQALAPYYKTDENVCIAADAALAFLAERQLADGGYASYGKENPESAAQVLVALSSLQIDCMKDARFQKNGRTIMDSILDFQREDGSFSHQTDGDPDETASVQVLCAMIAYRRMIRENMPFYIWSAPASVPSDTETQTEPVSSADPVTSPDVTNDESSSGWEIQSGKLWACACILLAGAIACVFCTVLKKRHYKNYLVIVLAAGICMVFVWVTDIQTADSYYGGGESRNGVGTVTLSIRCDTVVGKTDADFIPSDGVILPPTKFVIEADETVFDLLTDAARQYKIMMESHGSLHMAYVSGIQSLYEFDFGDLSGWMYYVNGSAPSVGCGAYILSDGDSVEWLYSCDLGNDLP